jgi:hypothetical protein
MSDVRISLNHLNSQDHHFLRYENLVTNTERTLMDLCEALRVGYLDSMVGLHSEVAKQLILPHEKWKNRVISSPLLSFNQAEKSTTDYESKRHVIQLRTESLHRNLEQRIPVLFS